MRLVSFGLAVALAASVSACGDVPSNSPGDVTNGSGSVGGKAPLLFGIGMHIEPIGPTAQMSTAQGGKGADYNNPATFAKGVSGIQAVVDIVEAHDGKLTIQSQSPFTTAAISSGSTVLSDWEASGHEVGLHFHEDAHLGANADDLPVSRWCAVFQQEVDFLHAAGVDDVRYWSGGNLYPHVYEAAECAGLSVNGDWKNPATQQMPEEFLGSSPWRPSGGTDGEDLAAFARHDPDGSIVFVPDGRSDRGGFGPNSRDGSDEAYFAYLAASLLEAIESPHAGMVNVFHFTIHPGEFRGSQEDQFAVIERFLAEVVDPLVASGAIQWATLSEMADAFEIWEAANPGVDPREEATVAVSPANGAPTTVNAPAGTATADRPRSTKETMRP